MKSLGLAALALGALIVTTGLGRADDERKSTKDRSSSKDLAKLEGTWRATREESGGNLRAAGAAAAGNALVIEGDKITTLWGGNNKGGSMTILKIDSKATPMTIDIEWNDGNTQGQKMYGIYKLTDNKLEICWGEVNTKKRPKKFTTKPSIGSGESYVTYKLEGKDEEPKTEAAKDAKKEQKKLEGNWRMTREESGGRLRASGDAAGGNGLIIEGDKITTLWGGNNKGGSMTILNLDSKATPMTIDVEWNDGNTQGQKMYGIYKLTDNKLEICWGEVNTKKRPKRFTTKPSIGSGASYVTYKREKDE
jgi:uncharacterized protein (TIGR03067 family)